MAGKKVEVSSPKIGIEPPGLELDLGYSILEARPSVKLKLSLGAVTRKNEADRFSIALREWWVRYKGRAHGKKGLTRANPNARTSFEDKVTRERHLKVSDLTSAAEVELGNAKKAILELAPPEFSAAHVIDRLRNQSSAWLKLFKEALIQAKQNYDKASSEYKRTEDALEQFVSENKLVAKRPPARMSAWDRAASLAALVVIEALISLPPIAERKGGQLILSFLYPVSVSIANALIGVLVGLIGVYAIRHSRMVATRLLAGIGVLASFGLVAWMNLAVARWREGNDTPLSLASFLPTTALSIVLMAIGIGVFAFAVYKGVRDFSPGFPGHEEKWDEHVIATADFHAWKDRYLLLVHEMRRTSTGKLDEVRSQIAQVRQAHEERRVSASQAIVDLQTVEKILPELQERINSSARILLKAYREAAFVASASESGSGEASRVPEPVWQVSTPDIQEVKSQVQALTALVDKNLAELTRFEERFEKEVAATINTEIEAVAADAKAVASS